MPSHLIGAVSGEAALEEAKDQAKEIILEKVAKTELPPIPWTV
jgi:hypothetical protein